ncbi:MAG: NAD(P)-binding domain-containing protein, partial [Vreelandella alkaliphila]
MADEQQMNVAVLGGGSFGTALASIAADNGAKVRQWMRDEALVTQINHEHRNGRYLPHYVINPAVIASTDLQSVLEDAELVLIAIPSKA